LHDHQWKRVTSYNHYYKIHQQLEVLVFSRWNPHVSSYQTMWPDLSKYIYFSQGFELKTLSIAIYIIFALKRSEFFMSLRLQQTWTLITMQKCPYASMKHGHRHKHWTRCKHWHVNINNNSKNAIIQYNHVCRCRTPTRVWYQNTHNPKSVHAS
jgi:hypothetical protein